MNSYNLGYLGFAPLVRSPRIPIAADNRGSVCLRFPCDLTSFTLFFFFSLFLPTTDILPQQPLNLVAMASITRALRPLSRTTPSVRFASKRLATYRPVQRYANPTNTAPYKQTTDTTMRSVPTDTYTHR